MKLQRLYVAESPAHFKHPISAHASPGDIRRSWLSQCEVKNFHERYELPNYSQITVLYKNSLALVLLPIKNSWQNFQRICQARLACSGSRIKAGHSRLQFPYKASGFNSAARVRTGIESRTKTLELPLLAQ